MKKTILLVAILLAAVLPVFFLHADPDWVGADWHVLNGLYPGTPGQVWTSNGPNAPATFQGTATQTLEILGLTSASYGYIPYVTSSGLLSGPMYTDGQNVVVGSTSPTDMGPGITTLAVDSTLANSTGVFVMTNSGVEWARFGIMSGFLTFQDLGGIGLSIDEESNVPIIFKTDGLERIRVSYSGNVGIGTSTPSQLLDVAGNANVQGILTGQVQVTGAAPGACSASIAGQISYSGHTTGTKDTAAICAADASDTWAWRTIY